MDFELLIALCTMWTASTLSLIVFFTMWFFNEGEAFHPHSVDIEQRHSFLAVSNSHTECKQDCIVKSISAFVAPRGSSSSKLFSVLVVIVAIAGFLGSARWHAVGDASYLEMCLSCAGFASLLLVAFFELDVVPERFLEDKLMVTAWLVQKMGRKEALPFSLHYSDPRFLSFIRESPGLYHLFEEDLYLQKRNRRGKHKLSTYHPLWFSIHLIGASGFASCCTAAILLNDMAEEKVAWIVACTFCLFSGMGYLTGGYYADYLPVFKCVRGWIVVWNPFVREPLFMLRLKEALDELQLGEQQQQFASPIPQNGRARDDSEGEDGLISSFDTATVQKNRPATVQRRVLRSATKSKRKGTDWNCTAAF